MKKIELASIFKKDYKRIQSNPRYANDLQSLFETTLSFLLDDKPLPDCYKDHELIGDWKGYRECHIKPDLLLIYKITATNVLRLARLGSHSELFKK